MDNPNIRINSLGKVSQGNLPKTKIEFILQMILHLKDNQLISLVIQKRCQTYIKRKKSLNILFQMDTNLWGTQLMGTVLQKSQLS